jgi:hypothetical protein
VVPVIRELLPTTGTSAIQTPEDVRQQRSALPPPAVQPALLAQDRARKDQARRYARLFRNYIPHCAHTQSLFLVRDADENTIYACNLVLNEVKNAYILFRLFCGSNIVDFAHYLRENNNTVPDYGEMGTPA